MVTAKTRLEQFDGFLHHRSGVFAIQYLKMQNLLSLELEFLAGFFVPDEKFILEIFLSSAVKQVKMMIMFTCQIQNPIEEIRFFCFST